MEYYYNREYGMFLADATEINNLKENDFSMTNFLKECRPSQGKSIYETTEKILDDQLDGKKINDLLEIFEKALKI